MKPQLVISEEWEAYTKPGVFVSWNWTLMKMIATSGVFDVKTKHFPIVRVPGAKNCNFNLLELNGKLVGIESWDTFGPTANYLDAGFFNDGVLKDLDLLIKIQYFDHPFWASFREKTGKRVSSWTIFPCHHFPLSFFTWQPTGHKYIATCTGRMGRFGRKPWVDFCNKNPDFYAKTEYNAMDTDESFREMMKVTKWGLSLKGKWSAVKNRRESEYSSCGVPLALNYIPTYPFEMKPNEHFVLLEKPEDLAKLRDINPLPYVEASKYLYENYFSPVGMSKQLIKLVEG